MIIINRGMRLVELLKQAPYKPYDVHWIVAALFAGSFGFLDTLPVNKVGEFETKLIAALNSNEALVSLLKRAGQVNPVNKRLLTKLVRQLVAGFKIIFFFFLFFFFYIFYIFIFLHNVIVQSHGN